MTAIAVAHSDHAPKASGPYSQAMVVGNLVYTAGQIPLDPASMEVVTGSIKQQTTRVLANLRAVLRAAGWQVVHVLTKDWLESPAEVLGAVEAAL